MCSLSLSTPSHQRCIHAPFASLHKNISCGAGAVWGVLPSACWRLLTSNLRGPGKGGHRGVDMRPWINRKKRIKARHLDFRLGPWNLAHWLAHTWLLINTCSMNEWRNWVVNEWVNTCVSAGDGSWTDLWLFRLFNLIQISGLYVCTSFRNVLWTWASCGTVNFRLINLLDIVLLLIHAFERTQSLKAAANPFKLYNLLKTNHWRWWQQTVSSNLWSYPAEERAHDYRPPVLFPL